MTAARCRACGAVVWWGRTRDGKLMPVDPALVEDGNVVLDRATTPAHGPDGGPAPVPAVVVLRKGEEAPDMPRYRSHFATCPNASDFRATRRDR